MSRLKRLSCGVFLAGLCWLGSAFFAVADFNTASHKVSPEVVAWWVAQSACQYLAAGAAVAKVAACLEE